MSPVTDLRPLFAPRTIAVIGASADPDKMGSVLSRSLEGFSGTVIRVNERAPDPASGLFGSVAEGAGGDEVDLVVLCVPAALCAGALDRAAAAGVRAALVCAGGFGEAGADGEAAQRALVEVADRHGIRLLGPNTSGFLAPGRGLFATFVPGALHLGPGRVGVVAASGGVNHALAFLLDQAGYGVSLSVGLGNAVDVTAADVVEHLADDPDTASIALHVESVPDGPRLLAAVRRASRLKPVVALVVGRADVEAFAQSHTGSLATAWRTTRAVLAQAGAVLVENERELVDAVGVLSTTRLDPSLDPGVALVTAQAGPGLLVLDDLRHHEVRLPILADATQRAIAEHLPPITYQANPVDTGRPGESFSTVLEIVGADPAVDLVAVYALSEPGAVDLALAVKRGAGSTPVVVAVGGASDEAGPTQAALRADGFTCVTDPTGLSTAVRALVQDAAQRARSGADPQEIRIDDDLAPVIRSTPAWSEHAAKDLLSRLGIATPRREAFDGEEAARASLETLTPPLAVKILDAEILHKTEIGGVRLGVATPEQLDDALRHLRGVGARQFLVEEMAPSGVDLLVGARRDPVFGPIVLLGLGGTVAEALADVSLRSAPVAVEEARVMATELMGRSVLDGWRGGPQVDHDALAQVLATLGALLVAHPDLAEVEINPLRVTPSGLMALDAVITRSTDAPTHP